MVDAKDKRIAELERQLLELQAARIAYAAEFPLTNDGEPDTGSIHQNIRTLKRQLAEAKEDTERLDWLTTLNGLGGLAWKGKTGGWVVNYQHMGATLREAIDVARKEAKWA